MGTRASACELFIIKLSAFVCTSVQREEEGDRTDNVVAIALPRGEREGELQEARTRLCFKKLIAFRLFAPG